MMDCKSLNKKRKETGLCSVHDICCHELDHEFVIQWIVSITIMHETNKANVLQTTKVSGKMENCAFEKINIDTNQQVKKASKVGIEKAMNWQKSGEISAIFWYSYRE